MPLKKTLFTLGALLPVISAHSVRARLPERHYLNKVTSRGKIAPIGQIFSSHFTTNPGQLEDSWNEEPRVPWPRRLSMRVPPAMQETTAKAKILEDDR